MTLLPTPGYLKEGRSLSAKKARYPDRVLAFPVVPPSKDTVSLLLVSGLAKGFIHFPTRHILGSS